MQTTREENYQGTKLTQLLEGKLPALGIDLGGTKMAAAMFDGEKLISEIVRVRTPTSPESIINQILELIADFQNRYVIAGVGLSTAGVVDPVSGEVIGSTPNLPGWEGTPVRKILESSTMVRVHVENDANSAAYAEWKAGQLVTAQSLAFITLGTGVGGGIIIGGKLHRGMNFAAGEVGHFKITSENKRICTCGLLDCWEEYGSGRGMLQTAREMLADIKPGQSVLAGQESTLATSSIVAAAKDDDIIAQRIIAKWHEHVSIGLATLGQILNPEAFILGGGLSEIVDLELLTELFKERTIKDIHSGIVITKSTLGNDAGIIGAAHLVLDEIAEAK